MKSLIILFLGISILCTCNSSRIKYSQNIFEDVNSQYPISKYNVILKAKDSTIYLENAKLSSNFTIHGEKSTQSVSGNKIIFYSSKNYKDYDGNSNNFDSNEPVEIKFTQENITKIVRIDSSKKFKKKNIYKKKKMSNVTIASLILLISTLLIFGITAIYLIFKALSDYII